MERLGLGIAALMFVELGQVVQAKSNLRTVYPERFLMDRKGALVERLGLGVAALVLVEQG